MTNDPLTLETTSDRLRLLAQKKLLGEQGLNQALKIAGYRPDVTAWEWFINYALLLLGTAFTLSGVFFFFAYNWDDLSRFAKFGIIEAAIVGAVALAYYQGLKRLVGQVALLVAAMLVGALLAVYGQIYQTGADAYQLFLTWAALITGWVIISAFGPLWFSWLVLLNISLILYWEQVLGQDEVTMFELLFVLDAVALLAWEVGASRGLAWLKSRWIPRLIALAVFAALLWPVFSFINAVHEGQVEGLTIIIAPILYLGFILLAGWLYGAKIKDLFILTIGALSLIAVITYALAQMMNIFEGDALTFLVLGILLIIQAGVAVIGLRWVATSWEKGELMTLQQLLERLAQTGDFNLDRQAEAQTILAAAESSTPWYVQGLVGISAWIAALCFIGFLAIAEIITSESGATIMGIIFCVAAVGLKWWAPRSTFGGQLALAIGLAGQALFIVGVGSQTDSEVAAAVAAIGLELILLAVYRDTFQRLLSTLIIVGAIVMLFSEWDILEAVQVLILLLAAATLFIWEHEAYLSTTRWWAGVYRPVGYGCAIALLALLTPSVVEEIEIEQWWLSALGLLALLLVLEYLTLAELGLHWRDPVALGLAAGTLALLWPAWQTPGLLGALLVLLVGFRRGNRLLMGLAAIFLAFFIIAFYYNLELTLLTKSFMLMSSGVIILALRYFLLRFWRKDASPV